VTLAQVAAGAPAPELPALYMTCVSCGKAVYLNCQTHCILCTLTLRDNRPQGGSQLTLRQQRQQRQQARQAQQRQQAQAMVQRVRAAVAKEPTDEWRERAKRALRETDQYMEMAEAERSMEAATAKRERLEKRAKTRAKKRLARERREAKARRKRAEEEKQREAEASRLFRMTLKGMLNAELKVIVREALIQTASARSPVVNRPNQLHIMRTQPGPSGSAPRPPSTTFIPF